MSYLLKVLPCDQASCYSMSTRPKSSHSNCTPVILQIPKPFSLFPPMCILMVPLVSFLFFTLKLSTTRKGKQPYQGMGFRAKLNMTSSDWFHPSRLTDWWCTRILMGAKIHCTPQYEFSEVYTSYQFQWIALS